MTHVHSFFFFFNDTATTEIYTLSLHDALPISGGNLSAAGGLRRRIPLRRQAAKGERGRGEGLPDGQDRQAYAHPARYPRCRSEEHTSELQSRQYLVCRLLLEKKKKKTSTNRNN